MRFLSSIIFFICVLCASNGLFAQDFSSLSTPSLLVNGSEHYSDMFEVGDNPAWLFQRQQTIPLWIHFTQQSSSGDFHRPFDPGNSTLYQYYVEGQKNISANHIVHGVFGVVQEFRSNWMWSDTKSYDNGNPIMIADSSTGLTDFRGLVLNGTYSGLVGDQWLIGATVKYGVDNGVKRISPKPLTMQRNIEIVLGTAFRLTNEISFGTTLFLKNDKEENDFTADQTTTQSQTILFKFKSYDTYQKFTKNSENRIVRFESYGGNVQSSYMGEELSTTLSAGYRIRFAEIVDGGSAPVQQGYWQSEIVEGKWAGKILFDGISILSNADISFDQQWTQHPDFSVLMTKQDVTRSTAGIIAKVPLFGVGLTGGYSILFNERVLTDYVAPLSATISSYTHTMMVGGSVNISEKNSFSVWYALDITDPNRSLVSVATPSELYAFVGAKNFGYESASVNGSTIGADVSFDSGYFGHCTISGLYCYRKAVSSLLFNNATRSIGEISVLIEL